MNPTTPSTYGGTSAAVPATPTPVGRGGGVPSTLSNAATKRGRKPRGPGSSSATSSPHVPTLDFKMPANTSSTYQSSTPSQWPASTSSSMPSSSTFAPTASASGSTNAPGSSTFPSATPSSLSTFLQNNPNPTTAQLQSRLQQLSLPSTDFASTATRPLGLSTPTSTTPIIPASTPGVAGLGGMAPADEEGEDDELLPAMADDDYSAQLSWQSQSKDNLKVLMDNFTEAQYDRFEAYRRHALPKQGVRKVIQQTLGQQVSQPVAQIVAGFSKVFVGEIVEKARAVQARRGERGPLTPDHLREAYRLYQEETGRVGTARPLRGKKLFVR